MLMFSAALGESLAHKISIQEAEFPSSAQFVVIELEKSEQQNIHWWGYHLAASKDKNGNRKKWQ